MRARRSDADFFLARHPQAEGAAGELRQQIAGHGWDQAEHMQCSMRLARWVFLLAGVLGILAVLPN